MRFAVMLSIVVSTVCVAPMVAQLHVPGDYHTVQEAIDASAPGGVVVIHGGLWTALTIDKPLTLVGDPADGDPAPLFRGTCGTHSLDPAEPAILLDGPGHGSVVLENLRVIYEGTTDSCATLAPLVYGGGFDELVVLASELRGTDGCCDEYLVGEPAIYVEVGSVFVSQSTVVGGMSSTNQFDCNSAYCKAASGRAGIVAQGATVVLLDSEVSGGAAQSTTFASEYGCPTSCGFIESGHGGGGVSAASLFLGNSTIVGGAGGTFGCDNTSFTCTKPSGLPIFAAQLNELSNSLISSGPIPLGGRWKLTWSADAPMALLALSLTPTAPVLVGSKGWLFMDIDTAALHPIPGGGTQSRVFAIAYDPRLAGLVITAQVYDPANGLTRPVLAPILP